jgi:hypothetical protein
MRRNLRSLLIVFAFLFAQVGYTAHLVTHLVAPVNQHQGHLQADPCQICLGYSHLGSGPLVFKLLQPPLIAVIQDWSVPDQQDAKPVFLHISQARAPPFSLV